MMNIKHWIIVDFETERKNEKQELIDRIWLQTVKLLVQILI